MYINTYVVMAIMTNLPHTEVHCFLQDTIWMYLQVHAVLPPSDISNSHKRFVLFTVILHLTCLFLRI